MHEVTLLDGGMGQELVRRSGKAPSPLWSATVMLEQPELVEQLHMDFIHAGAEVITINAYSSTPERLARDADESLFEALQTGACEAAMRARDKSGNDKVRITGCLPPLVASYRPDLAPGTARSMELYRRICAVQEPHVDLFLCETMASQAEAVSAATAACETGLPVWLAMTLDDNNPENLRGGEVLADVMKALRDLPLQGLLLNCSRPETIDEAWLRFAADSSLPIGAYANGFTAIDALKPGGTVSSLEARNDLSPESYADFAMRWVSQGATLIGGCCEVGPDHIACLRRRLDES